MRHNNQPKRTRETVHRELREASFWAQFAGSGAWKRLKQLIIDCHKGPADQAWHSMVTDGKPNEEIVRNLMSQRATVKTCDNIINDVENNIIKKQILEQELRIIESHTSKK
jgi:hypothetical protein